MSRRTSLQQPVQDLATSGSAGRSMAVTRKVGAGQNWPPAPSTSHSCTHSASSSDAGAEVHPAGKALGEDVAALCQPGSALRQGIRHM